MLRERRSDHSEPDFGDLEESPEDPADAVEFMGTADNRPNRAGCRKTLSPSFLYIGLPHAGSTSLANQLNMHPSLSYGKTKEHRYFAAIDERKSLPLVGASGSYNKSFTVPCHVKHTFDATPIMMYLGNPEARPHLLSKYPASHAVESIKQELGPNVKIIVMLRDPVDNLISLYGPNYFLTHSNSNSSKHWRTCYADSLAKWVKVFGRSQVLFLKSEDYFADSQAVLDTIFHFVDVPRKPYSNAELKPHGRRRSGKRNEIHHSVRREFHSSPTNRECKQRLEEMTGMTFAWKES